MNSHLTAQQVSACILEEAGADIKRHLEECPDCRTELQRFRESLAEFRTSVRECSSAQFAWERRFDREETGHSRFIPSSIRWLAAAFVVGALAIGFVRDDSERQSPMAAVSADARLLTQVDTQLSQSVPRPLEPLTSLVQWSEGAEREPGAPANITEKN